MLQLSENWTSRKQLPGAPQAVDPKRLFRKGHLGYYCQSQFSVGEVRSGPVPGHFFWTRDLTVPSLMKYLGPGPGRPGTVYIGLVPVQTWSRRSSFSFYFIFQVTMRVRGAYLQWHNLPFQMCYPLLYVLYTINHTKYMYRTKFFRA